MNAGPGGFGNAPFTKGLILVVSGSSLLLQGSPGLRRTLGPSLVSVAQLLVFRHLGELTIGSVLLYYFRIFERQRGSERYAGYSLVALGLSQVVQIALTSLTPWKLHSGPYALLAANFVTFLAEIPPVQRFTLFGINLTDKALVYAAGMHLLVSSARHSCPSMVVGALVGLAYQTDFLGFKRLRVPSAVSRFFARTIGRLLGGDGQRRRVIMTGPQPNTQQNGAAQAPRAAQQMHAPARQIEPSSEALAQLVSMGFEEQRASSALQQSNNDVQTALSRLL